MKIENLVVTAQNILNSSYLTIQESVKDRHDETLQQRENISFIYFYKHFTWKWKV